MCLEWKEFWQQCVFSTVPSEWLISPILEPLCCLNSGARDAVLVSVFFSTDKGNTLCAIGHLNLFLQSDWFFWYYNMTHFSFSSTPPNPPKHISCSLSNHGLSLINCDYTYIRQIHNNGILILYFRHLELWEAKIYHPRNLDCGPLSQMPKPTKIRLVTQMHCVNKFSVQYNSNQHLGK